MTNTEAKAAIKAANLKQDGWLDEILDKMEDRFSAGYLTHRAEQLNEAYRRSDRDFRTEILESL